MLERRRRNKHYNAVPGDDDEGLGGSGEVINIEHGITNQKQC